MNNKWTAVKIKFLYSIANGGTPKSDESTYWIPGEIAWITPEDLSKPGKEVRVARRKISKKGLENSSANLVNKNSVVLSTRAPVGNPKMVPFEYSTNQGCKSMSPLNKNVSSPTFLYYYLSSHVEELESLSRGTTFLELSSSSLKNFKILKPSLKEQDILVKFLDQKTSEIDNLIEDKEKLITLLEEKRKTVITEAVTKGLNPNVKMKDSGVEWIGKIPENWRMMKLKRVISIHNGKEILEEVSEEATNSKKYQVYGSGGFFKWTNDFLFDGESVLFGRKGTLGKPLYIKGPFWTVDTMYYSKMRKAKAKFIYYVLLVFPWELITTNTALPSITSSDLGNELWSFPSIKEQNDIIFYLDTFEEEVNTNIELLKQQINLLQEYRQALIYEAVTGKIDIQKMIKETEQKEVTTT